MPESQHIVEGTTIAILYKGEVVRDAHETCAAILREAPATSEEAPTSERPAVPAFLDDLYQHSVSNLNASEAKRVAHLLVS